MHLLVYAICPDVFVNQILEKTKSWLGCQAFTNVPMGQMLQYIFLKLESNSRIITFFPQIHYKF